MKGRSAFSYPEPCVDHSVRVRKNQLSKPVAAISSPQGRALWSGRSANVDTKSTHNSVIRASTARIGDANTSRSAQD